jgi:hypothetical protein
VEDVHGVKNRDLVGGIGQIMFEMDYPHANLPELDACRRKTNRHRGIDRRSPSTRPRQRHRMRQPHEVGEARTTSLTRSIPRSNLALGSYRDVSAVVCAKEHVDWPTVRIIKRAPGWWDSQCMCGRCDVRLRLNQLGAGPSGLSVVGIDR